METTNAAAPSRILEVAGRLFAEKGFSNVSIREVCRLAETTPPMIYYYFGDKKGLFNAAISRRLTLQEFIARLRRKPGGKTAADEIAAFIDSYLSSFPESAFDPGLYMKDTAKLDRESAEKIGQELDEIHRIATSIVRTGIESGEFRKTDASKAGDCLIGMLNRVVFQKIHFSRAIDSAASKRFIKEFFLRAMK